MNKDNELIYENYKDGFTELATKAFLFLQPFSDNSSEFTSKKTQSALNFVTYLDELSPPYAHLILKEIIKQKMDLLLNLTQYARMNSYNKDCRTVLLLLNAFGVEGISNYN